MCALCDRAHAQIRSRVPLSFATCQIHWAKFIITKFLVRLMYLVLGLTVVSSSVSQFAAICSPFKLDHLSSLCSCPVPNL